jgi:hypothetical protein
MSTAPEDSLPRQVRRIGILLADLGKLNENKAVLQFLLLQISATIFSLQKDLKQHGGKPLKKRFRKSG